MQPGAVLWASVPPTCHVILTHTLRRGEKNTTFCLVSDVCCFVLVSFRLFFCPNPLSCHPECSLNCGCVLMSLAEPRSLCRTEKISFVATFLLFMTSVQFVYYKMIYI